LVFCSSVTIAISSTGGHRYKYVEAIKKYFLHSNCALQIQDDVT
jgi:hypothetical protein